MPQPLPPKRFQSDGDPIYDPIRHHLWFAALASRREKIGVLEQAKLLVDQGQTQDNACLEFGVDKRELRDYISFVSGRSRLAEIEDNGTRRTYQGLLDQAYDVYRDIGGQRAFTKVIYEQAPIFGIDARPVVELWDIDPAFYPTQYRVNR